jgi:protein phosphatase
MKLASGVATDRGQIRDNNEDAFLVDDEGSLYAVADGMGGHRGGEVASHTAIEALRASIASGAPVDNAITSANTAVLERAATDDELTGMGTTLTAIVVSGPHQLVVGHVGDSRAYLLRDGTLTRITEDHSLVEELVRDGRLTPEQAEAHPQRAIITRALGVDTDVDVDLYAVDVAAGDRLIICSDGLTTMLRDREVERIARGERDPQHTADALVAAANTAGGEDNITVIVIDVIEVDVHGPTATAVIPAVAAAPASAPSSEQPAEPDSEPPAPKLPRSRGRTARGIVLVLLPILLVVGIAAGATGWYARNSYYVGQAGNEVVIYKGVPGGVLGWKPTVDQRTGIKVAALTAIDRQRVHDNSTRGSLTTARDYVNQLQGSITTTTTTTTTRPRRHRTTTTRHRTTTTVKKP